MTAQESIDHDIRQLIGDLQVQLIFARAQIGDMQEQLVQAKAAAAPPPKANGKLHVVEGQDERSGAGETPPV